MSHSGSVLTNRTVARGKPGARLAALIVAAGAVAGCAQQHGQQEANAALVRPQPAYCQPRPAPDCTFRNTSLRTVDPAEFARLKLAYERRCIRHAEKTERERMHELQASGACEGRPAPSLATSR
ncbi:hypothetical protein [Bradyrhizobium sp.]|uniref:hypothetical protein n=1 Tax=Bradyrhizobium sp. TaxID=376 RepID=UPI001DFF017F|nr:hypothetical protein [Bradyrhizobium sp.]MBI5321005.1 hypothetical protein [Bradyrhizobium sp.]